jgi:hypothetical protein
LIYDLGKEWRKLSALCINTYQDDLNVEKSFRGFFLCLHILFGGKMEMDGAARAKSGKFICRKSVEFSTDYQSG